MSTTPYPSPKKPTCRDRLELQGLLKLKGVCSWIFHLRTSAALKRLRLAREIPGVSHKIKMLFEFLLKKKKAKQSGPKRLPCCPPSAAESKKASDRGWGAWNFWDNTDHWSRRKLKPPCSRDEWGLKPHGVWGALVRRRSYSEVKKKNRGVFR